MLASCQYCEAQIPVDSVNAVLKEDTRSELRLLVRQGLQGVSVVGEISKALISCNLPHQRPPEWSRFNALISKFALTGSLARIEMIAAMVTADDRNKNSAFQYHGEPGALVTCP